MITDAEWIAIYKLARLGLLAGILAFMTWRLYGTGATDHEEPARRMLEEDDAA